MFKLKKPRSRELIRLNRNATLAVRPAAARVRVAADRKMDYKTPDWIVHLADESVPH